MIVSGRASLQNALMMSVITPLLLVSAAILFVSRVRINALALRIAGIVLAAFMAAGIWL